MAAADGRSERRGGRRTSARDSSFLLCHGHPSLLGCVSVVVAQRACLEMLAARCSRAARACCSRAVHLAKTLARLQAEPAFGDQRFEIGRWARAAARCRAARSGGSRASDRCRRGRRSPADPSTASRRPKLALITVSTVSASQMPCSTSAIASRHKRMLQPVADEARHVLLHVHRHLAGGAVQRDGPLDRRGDVHCVPITSTSGTR